LGLAIFGRSGVESVILGIDFLAGTLVGGLNMDRKRAVIFLMSQMLFILAMNCECDEGGTNIHGITPVINDFYAGSNDQLDGTEEFSAIPESDQIDIDFQRIDVGTSAARYLYFHNVGNGDLRVNNLQKKANSSEFYTVACSEPSGFVVDCALSVENGAVSSGDYLIVRVIYAPQEVGSHAAGFTLSLNTKEHKELTINLTGEGVTPEIEVCIDNCIGDQQGADCTSPDTAQECNTDVAPARLDLQFGDAVWDDVAKKFDNFSRKVVIRNKGEESLLIESIKIPATGFYNQFSIDANQQLEVDGSGNIQPKTLEPNAEVEFFVNYQPFIGGEHDATLQIISNDVNEREISLNLLGRALAPRICADPVLLNFGTVATNEPDQLPFTITNCGLLPLTIDDLTVTDDTSGFFSLPSYSGPTTLDPGAVLSVDVQYYPLEEGSHSGNVHIYSNDPVSDETGLTGKIALRGNSIPRACRIQATPFKVNFGSLVVADSDTLDVFISNEGNDVCTINQVLIKPENNTSDNEFSMVSQTLPAPDTELQPGENVVVSVKYQPANLGIDQGIMTIVGNDKDGPEVEVPLEGEGVATAQCDVEISGYTTSNTEYGLYVNFGLVKVSNSMVRVVTLTNRGNAPCNFEAPILSDVTFVIMPMPFDFELASGPTGPFTIARRGQPGDSVEIGVAFAPEDENVFWGRLWLHTDDDPDLIGGSPLCTKPGVLPPQTPDAGDACVFFSGFSAESDIEVVPSQLDFGMVTLGCNSPEMQVTVYNLGSYDLVIQNIYLENPNDPTFQIREAPVVPYTLRGGNNFVIKLRYRPQGIGTDRSALYIESDASNVQTLTIPLLGRGTDDPMQTDVFQQPQQVKADILFVIDNSGSMDFAQQALANNFSSFINWATSLDVDFQLGVIATEVNESEADKGNPPRDIHPGVLVNAPNRPKIITNSTTDIEAAFIDNVRIGECCSDEQEAGLEAAWMALSPPNINDPTMNLGFLRDDAKLYIICVSDEDDQSKGAPDFYVDVFSSIKGYRNTAWMKVSAIVGPDPKPESCSAFEAGVSYLRVQQETGGIFESICTSNWAQALSNLGIDAFDAIREWALSRPANANTISVTVNGQSVPEASCDNCDTCPDGWVYYPASNSVCFGSDYIPEKGAEVIIDYEASCL
jgi:hypothetical protein